MIIKNIRVIDPSCKRDEVTDFYICDKVVVSREEYIRRNDGEKDDIIDGTGLILGPGFVDVHVHFRDPGQEYKEDIHTGALAAIKGGYTSVVMMANTVPSIDSPQTLKNVLEKAKEESLNIYACAAVTEGLKGEKLTDFDELYKAGAIGFTDDGKPVLDEKLLSEAMISARELDVPISLHEEDPKFIISNGSNKTSPREAEISMIKRDIEIASESKAKLNIQHISSKEGVELVRNAKKTNQNIHCEATPHHISLTESAVEKFGTNAKMNPPLREEDDRQAIWEGITDGTIDIIATDHAPHSKEEKSRDFKDAPSGIIGLETAFCVVNTVLIKREIIDYSKLFELMSLNPARLYGINAGTLKEGTPADIVIFDPDEVTVFDSFRSKSWNSPFLGKALTGKIKYTIVGGKTVYDDNLNMQETI